MGANDGLPCHSTTPSTLLEHSGRRLGPHPVLQHQPARWEHPFPLVGWGTPAPTSPVVQSGIASPQPPPHVAGRDQHLDARQRPACLHVIRVLPSPHVHRRRRRRRRAGAHHADEPVHRRQRRARGAAHRRPGAQAGPVLPGSREIRADWRETRAHWRETRASSHEIRAAPMVGFQPSCLFAGRSTRKPGPWASNRNGPYLHCRTGPAPQHRPSAPAQFIPLAAVGTRAPPPPLAPRPPPTSTQLWCSPSVADTPRPKFTLLCPPPVRPLDAPPELAPARLPRRWRWRRGTLPGGTTPACPFLTEPT